MSRDQADAELARVFAALHPVVTQAAGRTSAVFEPQPEHRGNPGRLHGGMAATVLDHVSARCAAIALGQRVVTARLDLRYRHPIPLDGGPYTVEAEASPPRRRTVQVRAAILGQNRRRLVEGRSLFVVGG